VDCDTARKWRRVRRGLQSMDFWGYILIAFGLLTLIETAVCCVLQRRWVAKALRISPAADHGTSAADVERKDVARAVPKAVALDFEPYSSHELDVVT
jgi:hypothetical protein